MAEKYTLVLDRESALIVNRACDLYSRLMFGQFDVLPFEILMAYPDRIRAADFMARKETAEKALEEARRALFPELPYNRQSYGVGHNRASDASWNVHQVLRHAIAYHDHPEGGYTVEFDRPIQFSGAPMPTCEVKEDENK